MKSLAFSDQEYVRRTRAVQAEMERLGLDVMLATTLASVCYLTGIESVSPHKLWAVALRREGKPVLLCQDFEGHNARLGSWVDPSYTYGIVSDPIEILARMLKELGAATIGTETAFCWSSLPAQSYVRLRELLPKSKFVDASGCVGRAMSIKSAAEIECIRRAADITSRAMSAAIASVRAGATDNDVAAAAYAAMIGAGSEYSAYPVIVTTGTRSSIPHSTFHRVPIQPGDPAFIEIAAAINRYHAPMMRVVSLGEPSARLRELRDAASTSVATVIKNIRPGRNVADIARAAQSTLASIDDRVVWHGHSGYSVGLGFPPEWSDCPSLCIRVDGTDTLRPGMVFHVSTSLRDVGICGATRCETVLVTEDGCEVLTRDLTPSESSPV